MVVGMEMSCVKLGRKRVGQGTAVEGGKRKLVWK